MPKVEGRELPYYNSLERKINYLSHLFGALLSVVFSVFIIMKACESGSAMKIAAVTVYCITVINMFSMSTVYHYVKNEETRRKMQKMDHISISISIAGSATPLLLFVVGGTVSIVMVSLLWAITVFCIICNSISPKKFMIVTIICYVIMGWILLVFVKDLYVGLTPLGFYLLLSGGIAYTVGIIPFSMVKHNYGHAVWHFFVLIGTFFIMASIYFFAI